MKLFPADYVPALSISASELPGQWVIPWYLSRRHKDRLWSMLVAALRSFDDRLHFADVRWAERHWVEERRLVLPSPVVLRVRVDAYASEEPAAVLEGVNRWAKGTSVLDFERPNELLAFGWLGPLKVRVLHRVMDVLLDRPPLADPQPVVDLLQEAARVLLTPVELLDFVEVLVEHRVLGQSLESARAFAFGDALAGRFEGRFAYDVMGEALRDATKEELSAKAKRVLSRVGLLDGEARASLLLLAKDPEIRQRALEAMGRRVSEARLEEEPAEEPLPMPSADPRMMPIRSESMEPPKDVVVSSALVRDALALMVEDPGSNAGLKMLFEALRNGDAKSISKEDARVAGRVLFTIAKRRDDRGGDTLPVKEGERDAIVSQYEAAADYFRHGVDANGEAHALALAASRLLHRYRNVDEADRLLTRAQRLWGADLSDTVRAEYLETLARRHAARGEWAAVGSNGEQAAALFHQIGAYDRETEALLHVAIAYGSNLDWGRAVASLEKARICTEQEGVPTWLKASQQSVYGGILFLMGDYESAQNAFVAVTKIAAETGIEELAHIVFVEIAHYHARAGALQSAENFYEAAIPVLKRSNMQESLARAYCGRGDLHLIQGNSTAASTAFEKSLQSARAINNLIAEANALRGLAKTKILANEPAPDELARAEELSAKMSDLHGLWLSRTLRAATLPEEEALPLLLQCEALFLEKELPFELCITRGLLALHRNTSPDEVQALLEPQLHSRAEVVASMVKAGRKRDARNALLAEIPTH